jgi:hypothetical protein
LRTRNEGDAGHERSGERQGFNDLDRVHFNSPVLPSFPKLYSASGSQMLDLPMSRFYVCRDEPGLNGTF